MIHHEARNAEEKFGQAEQPVNGFRAVVRRADGGDACDIVTCQRGKRAGVQSALGMGNDVDLLRTGLGEDGIEPIPECKRVVLH